jgi:phosphate transport system substrate-binding protein
MLKRFGRTSLGLAAILILTATQSWAGQMITGAGATFPYPIYSKWFDAYGKATGTRINYQSVGSGAGIQQLKVGTVDFGASDAPLSNDDIRTMPSQVVHIPTVAGAVVVTYNLRGVNKPLKLTPDVIAKMFLGRIQRWDDPAIRKINPGVKLPGYHVQVAHRSDGSGTSFIFTNYLAAISPEWKSKVGAGKSVKWPVGIGGKGNEGVAGVVKQTPGAIGYVELAYAVQNHLPYALVRNKAGQFVKATVASTTAAAASAAAGMSKDVRTLFVNAPGKNSYPIAGFTYMLVYKNQKNAEKARELCKFLRWANHSGQHMASSLLYAPLPEKLVKLNDAALKSIKANGRPVL